MLIRRKGRPEMTFVDSSLVEFRKMALIIILAELSYFQTPNLVITAKFFIACAAKTQCLVKG